MFVIPLIVAVLAACATPRDIKQIETKVDVLTSKATESKTEMSSSLGDVLHKQETFERWQNSTEERFQVFVRNQADIKADIDSIDRKINGLGGGTEETQHMLKKLDGRLTKLDERLREFSITFVDMDDRLAKLDGRLHELSLMAVDTGMNQQLKIEALQRDLAARLEPIKADVADIRALIAAKQKKTPVAKKAAPTKVEAKKATPPAPPGRSADELYSGGYTDYLKGDFAAAEAAFAEYVHRFPDTGLTGNAQYWTAEALANQGKSKEAVEAFSEAAKNFPHGAKAATALWRAAEILEKVGDRDKAREFLREIVDNYPTSYEAAMVEDKLKTLDESGN